MTFISNDPVYLPSIDFIHVNSYFVGSWRTLVSIMVSHWIFDAVASGIAVVYDWGEQPLTWGSICRWTYWYSVHILSTDIRTRGMFVSLPGQPSHSELYSLTWSWWATWESQVRIIQLIRGRGNAGPSWLSYILVYVAYAIQLVSCADINYDRCATLDY
jgi:hypothetical protein